MKKILFLLSVAALLLPLDSSAQSKPKIKSVDFTIQVPTPGMSLFDAREMQFTSAKTEFGDLAATGGIQVQEIDWIGDFREDDEGDMFFKDGFIYKARIKFMVDPSGKYDTDYIFKDNDYYIDGSRISATVNGVQAKVERSAPYFIDIEVSMPVGAGGKGSMRDLAQSSPTDYELNKDSYRASQKAYSIAEADAACPDVSPLDVITINNTYHAAFRAMREFGDEFIGHKNMLVTKVIVDTDDERIYGDVASDVNNTIQGPFNIREVWLSDKVDAVKFIRAIFAVMQGYTPEHSDIYCPEFSYLFHTQRATLFIPETAVADVRAMFSRPTWSFRTLFSLKTYSGDVHSAQGAGATAAKPFCTSHVFTDKVAAADKVFRYGTCSNWPEYYYSCKICGKCEHNDKHVFSMNRPTWEVRAHQYDQPVADDQAYVGVNSAGQHVWWYSCIWCGHSEGYDQRHITKAEWQASGTEGTYESYRDAMADMTKQFEESALLKTTAQPGMFILKKKSDSKMSPAFQSSVNFALNDNLLDESVLGNDYTLPLNHRQLNSLAEHLVKELTGSEATASSIGLDKALGGKAPAAALLAQNGMVGITLRDHAGNQFLALPVGARHHVVDVGFGLDRQPVAPEVGELYSARGLRQLHGEFQQFVVHAIRIRRNTCKTAEWSPRPCRTARVRSFRWASGWRPRPDRNRSAAI